MVVKIHYMNTNRDNFHDWARDKEDSTSFAGLHSLEQPAPKPRSPWRWSRLGWLVLVGVALVVGFKYLAAR